MSTIYKCDKCGKTLDGFNGNWLHGQFYCAACLRSELRIEANADNYYREMLERDITKYAREHHCSRRQAEIKLAR